MKKAYLPLELQGWETILVNGCPLYDPNGSIGLIKVYETLEALREFHPYTGYVIIEFPVTIKGN